MRTIEEVREMFLHDRFATENGAVIEEIGEHRAKCSMRLAEHHKNAMGAVMGGASYTLADFAFAVAANWADPGVVSVSAGIDFLGTAKGERLIAEAVCIKAGRTTEFYQVDVRDELGTAVAVVHTVGHRV